MGWFALKVAPDGRCRKESKLDTPDTSPPEAENLTPGNGSVETRLDALTQSQAELAQSQAELAGSYREIRDLLAEHIKENREFRESQLRHNEATDRRFEKIERDLGYLKGGHAVTVAQRDAILIADDMGYQLVSQLPREILIGFSKMARDSGKLVSDVDSFRKADLVILARDGNGYPAYLAVEASFTVDGRDIQRARRNAEYLHEFTGLPARAAVAGVDIPPRQYTNANVDGVYCYFIPVERLASRVIR